MRKEDFFEVLGELDDDIVKGAETPVKRKISRKAWGAMAACIAVIAVLGVGIVQSGLFGSETDIATLDSGDRIVFAKLKTAGSSIDIAGAITTRQLTEEELAALFPGMPVTAHAVFTTGDAGTGHAQELIGFEGNIGTVKMVVSTSDMQLLDTVLAGQEGSSEINGTDITAGYFVTGPSSKCGQNAIYYAAFELGSCKMYLENSGAKENREAIKNQLAEVIQKLIENGEPDLTSLSSLPRP